MTRFARLEQQALDLQRKYDQLTGKRDALQEQLHAARQEKILAEGDIANWQQVQALFGKVSEFAREQLVTRVEQTVTAALQAIFEDSRMEFRIELKQIGGKPAAEWLVASCYGSTIVTANPEDARGGGITDVVSLALRLALMELARPIPLGPVILDEPGKMISREYIPNLAAFLKEYAQQTNRQVIMVTHHEGLADVADLAYRVEQVDGISAVVRV